jgi:TPR repeat protein
LRNGVGVPKDFPKAAHYLKLAADQGFAKAQFAYGICLHDGVGVSMDLPRSVHYLKLAADQGFAAAQFAYRIGLPQGNEVPMDPMQVSHSLKPTPEQKHSAVPIADAALLRDGRAVLEDRSAAPGDFRFAAEEGGAEAQYRRGMSLLSGSTGHRNIPIAIRCLQLSAENGSPEGQFAVACMAENGIAAFHSADLGTAVRYYERSCDRSPAASACLGWCLQTGRGIPVDFTVAAECFKHAADSDDADGINCFGCCLERGKGVEVDIDGAVSHYRRAASKSHSDALYNFGRCLEYGIGIDRNPQRAAKYYRLSAEMKNASAQNSFGICLERGIGVHKNLSLAALFYRRAADQGHADGANNFGFCLEHCRGVQQNIEMAAQYYRFAADRGHREAKVNLARCMRLLGRWNPPDRSSDSVSHSPSPDRLSEIFRPFLESPAPLDCDERRLLCSLQRIKTATAAANAIPIPASPAPAWVGDEIGRGDSSVVRIALDSESNPIAVKTAKNADCAELIHREAAILKALKHPLILELRAHSPEMSDGGPSIATEYAGNGSLADLFAADGQRRLWGPNRIAKAIAGIALAMRFAHSRGAVHRDLRPANILVAWDWTVRIADFGRSAGSAAPRLNRPHAPWQLASVDPRYLAPECYDGTFRGASDVFAFAVLFAEILGGRPALPEALSRWQIAFAVSVDGARPEIPESAPPPARALIEDCWAADPDDRPTFEEIVDRLAEMEFKVTADVNSAKVAAFVKRIEEQEQRPATE